MMTFKRYAAFHGNKEALDGLLCRMRNSIHSKSVQTISPLSSVRFSSPTASDLPTLMVEPLHFATMNNRADCVEVVLDSINLLEKEAGDVSDTRRSGINAKDRQGLAASHHAALNGHLDILKLLHKRGADILLLAPSLLCFLK